MRIPPKKDIYAALVFMVIAVALCGAAVWAYHEYMTTAPYVDDSRYPVRGIDVSAHNGDVDFREVRNDGYEFAFIKASEGVDFKDKKFRDNYRAAGRSGLMRGAYHFFRFDKDGVDQAVNFIQAVGNRKLELGLVIDVEKEGNPEGVSTDDVKEQLQRMIEFLNMMGHRVTLYTNVQGYEEYFLNTFAGQPLWICSFSSTPVDVEWNFWQYDHHGKVAGIEGDVDLNAYAGSREDWEKFKGLRD